MDTSFQKFGRMGWKLPQTNITSCSV